MLVTLAKVGTSVSPLQTNQSKLADYQSITTTISNSWFVATKRGFPLTREI